MRCAWLAFKWESVGMFTSFVYASRQICIERYSDLSDDVSHVRNITLQNRAWFYITVHILPHNIFWQPIKYARNWLFSRVQYTCNLIAMHGIASFSSDMRARISAVIYNVACVYVADDVVFIIYFQVYFPFTHPLFPMQCQLPLFSFAVCFNSRVMRVLEPNSSIPVFSSEKWILYHFSTGL